MDDRGEKIVMLAREMLRGDMAASSRFTDKPGLSLRLLCLSTLLGALGGGGVTEWIEQAQRPIGRFERTELDALVFYAARTKGLNEDDLRRDVQGRLAVDSFSELNQHEFKLARRYLQDRAE